MPPSTCFRGPPSSGRHTSERLSYCSQNIQNQLSFIQLLDDADDDADDDSFFGHIKTNSKRVLQPYLPAERPGGRQAKKL